ncbi:MAG: response regulator [Candidatus Zhuqueibacterota bacterium]
MKTVLIVDDEKYLRLLYEQELRDEGYRVIIAENGEQALEKIHHEQIDLAILDIKMEGMSGIETLKEIMDVNKDIKVILNSAYSSFKADFSTWSADAYLIKSSNLKELKEKVAELLELDNQNQ